MIGGWSIKGPMEEDTMDETIRQERDSTDKEEEKDYRRDDEVITYLGDVPITNGWLDAVRGGGGG